LRRPNEIKRPEQRLKVMPRIECDGEFLWKPYVPRRNDGILLYIIKKRGDWQNMKHA
jgi:hypothetical protein